MAISKEMIQGDKIKVIETLKKYLNATNKEIKQFIVLVESEDVENWTCGFGDELVPLFEEMRANNQVKVI
tara:strand:+ start:461 stop:670 length:210 start_codon:yes stop_codon:yes gene_type:complete